MNDTAKPTIALLGTGIMGSGMGRNLIVAGLPVRAWNRTREKAEDVEGADVAGTPREAAGGAGILVTMLSAADAVRAAVEGGDGALAALPDGALWLQMSTIGADDTRALAALAAGHGVDFVDAPVLGTRQPAEQGELLVLAAGPPALRGRAAPVFDAVGRETRWVGDAPGAASALKLVLNAWIVSLVAALAETIALARATGVDPRTFLETIDGGPIGLPYAQLKGGAMVAEEFEPTAFPLELAGKDAGLVLAAAEDAGLDLPLMRTVADSFAAAADQGHGRRDMAAVYHAAMPRR